MRVSAILATAALACLAGTASAATPTATHKVTCVCECPDAPKAAKPVKPAAKPAPRKPVRHAARRMRRAYDYASAAPVPMESWHEHHHAMMPPPNDGLRVDTRGFNGGVGYGAGGDGGFVDGYGQVHYAWGGMDNGPTYNSYGQSFQYNPSRPGPFVPQRMGAPVRAR